jgi:hypothetical protein
LILLLAGLGYAFTILLPPSENGVVLALCALPTRDNRQKKQENKSVEVFHILAKIKIFSNIT